MPKRDLPPENEPEGADDSLPLSDPGPPTDDTPTIISRSNPRPANGEETGFQKYPADSSVCGRRLAHFELIEPIGVGGMAAVLRARDTQLDRIVAIKILPPEQANDPDNVSRFHQEARSAARLDHENIARVFAVGEDQRLHYIVFEFVEGDNLRTILERRGHLPVAESLQYLLQVTAGLSHAAQRGVVHRDIKPSNIIITPAGRAKVVDMGLARNMERQDDKGLTHSNVTLGTFDYMSPEQALEPRDADSRSDIYSLGCTFYHMLTGRPPVPDGNWARKVQHHQNVKPVDPRQLVSGIPDEVAAILDRMMAKSVRDRYQTPDALWQALWHAAQNLGATPEMPQGAIAVEAELPPRTTGRSLLLVALAALTVVGLILMLDQPAPKTPQVAWNHDKEGPAKSDTTTTTPPVVKDTPPDKPPVAKETKPETVVVYSPPKDGESIADDLAKWVKQNSDAAQLVIQLPGTTLDLSQMMKSPDSRTPGGLLVKATQSIVLKALKSDEPPTIRFEYDASNTEAGAQVALTLAAPLVKVQGVRFVVDGKGASNKEIVALLLQTIGKATVENCEFVQVRPALQAEGRRQASLVLDSGNPETRPSIGINGCLFRSFDESSSSGKYSGVEGGGQDAIVRRTPATVDVLNCAFGPHAATFRIEDKTDLPFQVEHSSILAARRSAVFELKDEAPPALALRHSVVARVDLGIPHTPGDGGDCCPALLIHESVATPYLKFQGYDNCYAELDGYWAVGDKWQDANWKNFRNRMQPEMAEVTSDRTRLLLARPWMLTPDEQRQTLESGEKPEQAFKLSARWSELREKGSASRKAVTLVGVQSVLGRSCVSPNMEAASESLSLTEGRHLVVDPDPDPNWIGDGLNGVYPTLEAAVKAAHSRDIIAIRKKGTFSFEAIRKIRKELDEFTIRPARGFSPVLTLGAAEAGEALFEVRGGRLRLEGLEFSIQVTQDKGRVSLVDLAGNGECHLSRCVVTLERKGGVEASPALAVLGDPGRVMAAEATSSRSTDKGPLLELDRCFVRGEGDLLWSRSTRPCGLKATDSLVALTGSLLNVDLTAGADAPKADQTIELQLDRLTATLGSLAHLSMPKEGKGMVPITCTPNGCLFFPAPSARGGLIAVDAPAIDEKNLRETFKWTPGKNGYGFTKMMDSVSSSEEMPQMMTNNPKKFTDEGDSRYNLTFRLPEETSFVELEPDRLFKSLDSKGSRQPLGVDFALLPRREPPK
jgi:serine/threonine protein kinase